MYTASLAEEDDFEGWRGAARPLAIAGVPASRIVWQVGDEAAELFAVRSLPPAPGPAFSVPKAFLVLAESVICNRDRERFGLLYQLLLRFRSNPRALEDAADPLVQRLERMAKEVRRDIHKMHAFVRFREVQDENGTRYVAWFEPEHHIVRAAAGHFVERFAGMRWSILTPEVSVHWDSMMLREGPGATRADAPSGDPLEAIWHAYYAAIFNPARLKVGAMLREMPKKYWKNLPETALVGELIAGAQRREEEMVAKSRASLSQTERAGLTVADAVERRIEPGGNALAAWEALLKDAKLCTRCHLYQQATQTVFGEGPLDATIMFVGEQPGDQEDLAGRPFVGPAGAIFDKALSEAGIDRSRTYVTNAVKHFKFERRGKRRIHEKPQGPEIDACRFWIEQERALIRPPITVALGATAARSIFHKVVTIGALRGKPQALAEGGEAWVTVHPSFLLRVRDDREAEYAKFVADLMKIRKRSEALAR